MTSAIEHRNVSPFKSRAIEKKSSIIAIFLDTEFHQNYTFVSCCKTHCSIDVQSIGRIGKWQPRKQPRKSQRRPRRRSSPTQGKRNINQGNGTGDARQASPVLCPPLRSRTRTRQNPHIQRVLCDAVEWIDLSETRWSIVDGCRCDGPRDDRIQCNRTRSDRKRGLARALRYGLDAPCGAPFGVDKYPDTWFFPMTFTTSS